MSLSAPPSPRRMSLPPFPCMVSLPPAPQITSLEEVPERVSALAVPVSSQLGDVAGVARKAFHGLVAFMGPTPTICPEVLIALASASSQPVPEGIRLFRSCISYALLVRLDDGNPHHPAAGRSGLPLLQVQAAQPPRQDGILQAKGPQARRGRTCGMALRFRAPHRSREDKDGHGEAH